MEATSFGWGGPLQEMLFQQIKARGELLAKEGKTPEELTYLNSNTPWILLRSSVDVGTDASLARNFCLAGGTLYGADEGLQAPRGSDPLQNDSFYGLTAKMGFRPKPGIESLEVKTYSTMGCLQEATVHFKVWSLDDLEAIDTLYFKPGFAVLLEWGHSMGLSNTGQIMPANPANSVVPNSFFFTPHKLSEIEEKVDKLRNAACGNYEGIVGLITNFSYSFSKNGGYDCSLKILSKGAILEEMKAANTNALVKISNKTEDSDNSKGAESEQKPGTALATLVKALSECSETVGSTGHRVKLRTALKGRTDYEYVAAVDTALRMARYTMDNSVPVQEMEAVRFKVDHTKAGRWFWSDSTVTSSDYLHYISLADFLTLCTAFQAPYESSFEDKPLIFEISGDPKFRSFEEHFSLDPGKFLFGNAPRFLNPELKEFIPAGLPGSSGQGQWPTVGEKGNMGSTAYADGKVSFVGHIGEIWICLEYAAEREAECIQGESADKNFRWDTWLKDYILADLQRSLGNVNNFDLVATSRTDSNRYTVVDKTFIYNTGDAQNDDRRIPVTGLRSTVEDLQIQSEVSKNLANQFAIAATGGTADADVYANMSWRANLTNRHAFDIGLTNKSNTNVDEEAGNNIQWREGNRAEEILTSYSRESSKQFLEEAAKLYSTLYSETMQSEESSDSGYRTVSATTSTNLLVAGADIFKKLANCVAGTIGSDSDEMPVGIFPCTVNLTMKGLARFVVGEHFKIERGTHLSRYDNWGWIITGVDHKVDKHGWTTNLRTQYFPPTGDGTEVAEAERRAGTVSYSPLGPNLLQSEIFTKMDTKNQDPCRQDKVRQIILSLPTLPESTYDRAVARDGGRSLCARYAGNLAKMFTGNLSEGSDISKISWGANAGGSNNTFNQATGILQSYGYEVVSGTQGYVSFTAAKRTALSWAAQAGDVVHYQSENGRHYHMAFYTGAQWVSNFTQRSAWVYDSFAAENTLWTVKIYRARNIGCPESAENLATNTTSTASNSPNTNTEQQQWDWPIIAENPSWRGWS